MSGSDAVWGAAALTRVEVDEVWRSLGRYGRYQLLQVLALAVAGMSMAYPVLSGVFQGGPNPHKCVPAASFLADNGVTDNRSVEAESCSVRLVSNRTDGSLRTSHCDSYQYELPVDSSFVSEWNLVCGNSALKELSQTLVMAGMFVGAFFLSNLADRYGRKRSHIGCHMALFIAMLAIAYMPNYISFCVARFFSGVFQQGYLIPLTIYLLEVLPAEQRAATGCLASLLWAVSLMSMPPIAYALKNFSWRSKQLAFASFHGFFLLEIFILDESLRWLVANKRFDSMRLVIQKASRFNHRNPETVISTAINRSYALYARDQRRKSADIMLSSILEVTEEEANESLVEQKPEQKIIPNTQDLQEKGDHKEVVKWKDLDETQGDELDPNAAVKVKEWVEQHDEHSQVVLEQEEDLSFAGAGNGEKRKEGAIDLIRDPHMRFITLATMYIWMVCSVTYYGVILLSSSLAGNLYLNFFLGGLSEIPSCIALLIGFSRFGRNKTLTAFIATAGIALLGASLLAAFGGGNEAASVAQTIVSMIARFGISGAFNSIWIYTPEIFPTNIRNFGVGLASASARLGGMASPFLKLLAEQAIWAPGVIFSVNCLVVTVLMTQLPETTNRALPQTIADIRAWQEERQRKRKKQSKHAA